MCFLSTIFPNAPAHRPLYFLTSPLHRVDSLICTPKNSNRLRSHLRAIMALDRASECLNEHTRVKLQHNKEIIMFIFQFNGFIDV